MKWQDGKEITCEDLKYGFSRLFATDVITGGPARTRSTTSTSRRTPRASRSYKGPYSGEGQADYDKAVSCEGKTITYRFKKPWPDFNLALGLADLRGPVPQGPGPG